MTHGSQDSGSDQGDSAESTVFLRDREQVLQNEKQLNQQKFLPLRSPVLSDN